MTDITHPLSELFIFEVANNHEGDVEHGLRIVEGIARIQRKHGIRAGVKFQFRDLDNFIHPDVAVRDDAPHVPRFQRTRLNEREISTLIDAVREQGLIPVVTPFDEASVERCLDLGIEVIKVASSSALDWPLLESVAAARRPTVVSTGGLSIRDIDKIVSFLTHRDADFALMHCVALYPTPRDMLQLGFIEKMDRRYPGVPVGYSGHEDPNNLDAVQIAISKGATLLERHVGIATGDVTLNAYSLSIEQADEWVACALEAREMLGRGDDRSVSKSERESLMSLARGVYAKRDISPGDVIAREDVFFAMPCAEGQTTSGEFGSYRTTLVASRAYRANEAIGERPAPDTYNLTRSILYEAKGMLFEAQIVLGDEFEIELSHHYGIERFREWGAVIVNVLNREYCKKLVILLPGQQHPDHSHQLKEESFQLLWGRLEVTLDGSQIDMSPGDILLIEKGSTHSFTSPTGAIFEEISTTHFKHDSYYADDTISALDPIQRKTLVEDW